MEAKVLRDFRDRDTWAQYREGDAYHGTEARVSELAAGGYVEAPRPKAAPKAAPRKRTTRKTTARG